MVVTQVVRTIRHTFASPRSDSRLCVAEFLLRPPFVVFGKWRGSHMPGSATRGGIVHPDAELNATRELLDSVQRAVDSGLRLQESLRQSVENEPLANAASICRWELLVLRERMLVVSVPNVLKSLLADGVRSVDAAASACH